MRGVSHRPAFGFRLGSKKKNAKMVATQIAARLQT